jgi:hypothetical protein
MLSGAGGGVDEDAVELGERRVRDAYNIGGIGWRRALQGEIYGPVMGWV